MQSNFSFAFPFCIFQPLILRSGFIRSTGRAPHGFPFLRKQVISMISLYRYIILWYYQDLLNFWKQKNMFQPMWASVVQLWTYQLLNLAKYWDLASEVATPDPQTVANLMFFRAWRSPPNTAHQPTPSVKADGTLGDHTIQALPNSPQACISIRLRSLVNKELCFEKYRMLMNAGMLGFCRKNFMADLQPAAGAVLHYVVPT